MIQLLYLKNIQLLSKYSHKDTYLKENKDKKITNYGGDRENNIKNDIFIKPLIYNRT